MIDRALDRPERWATDPQHCGAAGVLETITFATNPSWAAPCWSVRLLPACPAPGWLGDRVDGADHALRRCIEPHGRGYVLTVTSAQRLGLKPVEDGLEDVPDRARRRLSAGNGSTGPRLYDWIDLPCRTPTAPGWQKGLVIRRKIKKRDEFTFYLTLAPTGTSLAELVRMAGTCWTVESCFETAKGEVGLDASEVRSWTGWHRHITLVPVRPCRSHRPAQGRGRGKSGWETEIDRALLLPTVPELCRLLWHLVWAHPPDPEHVLAWPAWRRRYRQRARRCHWKRRPRRHKVWL